MDLGTRHVTQLAVGTWQAEVLYTLAELDIFRTLAPGPRTAREVAGALGLHPETTAAVLNAGVALRLLSVDSDRYANTEISGRLLTGDTDESLLEWVRNMGRWARAWSDLTEVVRTGRPARGTDARLIEDPAYLEDMEIGFFRYATRQCGELVACVGTLPDGILLDLGGGCGAYAMALCRRHPGLRAVIWEMAGTVPLANTMIARRGMADRVSAVARDYTRDDYGQGLAAILMSNMLQCERRAGVADMLRRGYRALAPGGKLIINGNLLNDDRVSPVFPVLHNVSSMVLWDGGSDLTVGEAGEALCAAGFPPPEAFPIAGGSAHVLVATKPAAPDPAEPTAAASTAAVPGAVASGAGAPDRAASGVSRVDGP